MSEATALPTVHKDLFYFCQTIFACTQKHIFCETKIVIFPIVCSKPSEDKNNDAKRYVFMWTSLWKAQTEFQIIPALGDLITTN